MDTALMMMGKGRVFCGRSCDRPSFFLSRTDPESVIAQATYVYVFVRQITTSIGWCGAHASPKVQRHGALMICLNTGKHRIERAPLETNENGFPSSKKKPTAPLIFSLPFLVCVFSRPDWWLSFPSFRPPPVRAVVSCPPFALP